MKRRPPSLCHTANVSCSYETEAFPVPSRTPGCLGNPAWNSSLLTGRPRGMMVVRLDVSLITLNRERVPGLLWWQLPCYLILGQKMGRPRSFMVRGSRSSSNRSFPVRATCRGLLLQKTHQPHFQLSNNWGRGQGGSKDAAG